MFHFGNVFANCGKIISYFPIPLVKLEVPLEQYAILCTQDKELKVIFKQIKI